MQPLNGMNTRGFKTFLTILLMMAMDIIKEERERQVKEEGHLADIDAMIYDGPDLTLAAMSYEKHVEKGLSSYAQRPPHIWPWEHSWWKPKSRRQNLIRAGALYMAERERLERKIQQIAREIDSMPD
jgi:hypothetical protein